MRKLGTATQKGARNGAEFVRRLVSIVGCWAVLAGAAVGGEAAAKASNAAPAAGWTAPKAELSGKVLFDGGDVKVWSYDSRVMAGRSWQPAEKVTVSALAGGSYKQISMGGRIEDRSQVSHLGVAEVGGTVKVQATENVDLVLQATAGQVVLGCRETKTHAGTEDSQAASGSVAGIQAGIDWKLPGERCSLTAGVVYEQAKVSYERGADDSYGKMGFSLGLTVRF